MRNIRHFWCWLAFLLIGPASVYEYPLQQNTFTIRDNVNLVLLDVSVKDSRTGYISGLDKANFRVLEDGQPRPISQFGNVDLPVTVGLVVDNSGSMRSKKAEVLISGLAFARASNPQDEFFVVNFNNSVVSGLPPETPFTDNLRILERALYYGNPIGQTALYDAVSYALRHLERSHHEQRTLVIVSDGGDNISKISFPELLNQVEASRATLYTIGLVDPENRDLNPGVLRKMASISGGEYFQPPNLAGVRPVFEQISKDIRSRYSIGFQPDEIKDKRIIRNIKVIAERNGKRFAVKTRTTYRIPAPPAGNA